MIKYWACDGILCHMALLSIKGFSLMFPQARRWSIKAWNAKTWSLIQTISTLALIKCRAWHTCASSYTSGVNVGDTRWSTTVHKPNHRSRLTWVKLLHTVVKLNCYWTRYLWHENASRIQVFNDCPYHRIKSVLPDHQTNILI